VSIAGHGRSSLLGDPHDERRLLRTLDGVFHSPEEREHYLADSFERVQVVLALLDELSAPRRFLELGANPYVLTTLLRRRFGFDIELANYFGPGHADGGPFEHSAGLEGSRVGFTYRHFNVEAGDFPFEDASFDCVLFCEILEHLLVDPGPAVREMVRVLRPGGRLVVTTPNATRLPNLYFLALGRSVWDGYSANGPYGRHNREYSLREVTQLVEGAGCVVERTEVRNIQRLARRFTWLQWLRPDVWYEHLFVVARKP
jgi:SAM-dependent methyltransferase